MLIRKRAKQSEAAANYVKAVTKDGSYSRLADSANGTAPQVNGNAFTEKSSKIFLNGVGFDNGNGLWDGEQGFAIGGLERQSRLNGYLAELAAAAFVCRVSL